MCHYSPEPSTASGSICFVFFVEFNGRSAKATSVITCCRPLNIIAGFCLCGNGLLSNFARDAFVQERDFALFHEIRDTGFRILRGTTGYGIPDFTFCTGPGDESNFPSPSPKKVNGASGIGFVSL